MFPGFSCLDARRRRDYEPLMIGDFQGFSLWLCQNSDIENGPVEIVDLPIDSMVDLSIVFCMFTRG